MRNLSRELSPVAISGLVASTAAGSTDYSDKLDTKDFNGVLFSAIFRSTSASTGTAVFSIVGTDTSTAASTSYAAINGAAVTVCKSTTAKTRWASVDVYLPKYRYMKSKIVRTSKIGTNAVLAQRYASELQPTVPGSSTIAAATVVASNVLCVAGT